MSHRTAEERILREYLRQLVKESDYDSYGYVSYGNVNKLFVDSFVTPWKNLVFGLGGEAQRLGSTLKLAKNGLFNTLKSASGIKINWNESLKEFNEKIEKIKSQPSYKEAIESLKEIYSGDIAVAMFMYDPDFFITGMASLRGKEIKKGTDEKLEALADYLKGETQSPKNEFDSFLNSMVGEVSALKEMSPESFAKKYGESLNNPVALAVAGIAAFNIEKWLKNFTSEDLEKLGDLSHVKKVLSVLKKNKMLIETAIKSGKILEASDEQKLKTLAAISINPSAKNVIEKISKDAALTGIPEKTITNVVNFFLSKKKIDPSGTAEQVKQKELQKFFTEKNVQTTNASKETIRNMKIKQLEQLLNGASSVQSGSKFAKKIEDSIKTIKNIKL